MNFTKGYGAWKVEMHVTKIAFCAFHSHLVEVQTNAGYKYMRHMRNNQCLNLTVVHSSKMSKKFQKRVVLFPTSPRDE